METNDALEAVANERNRQKEIGTDGELTETNDLIAAAVAYLGRAAEGVRRNSDLDSREMLTKAAAILVDAIERA